MMSEQQLKMEGGQLSGNPSQLKKGYKETEIGLIPDDWDVSLLENNVTKVGSGITPKGGSTVYKGSGRPFVRSQNIGWGILKLNDIAFIDEETHESFSATEIDHNDVLLNITGASIGRCALATSEIVGGNVNQHVCIIRANDELIDAGYLCRILLSDIGQRQIESFQAGGNREGLNFGQIKSFHIPLPPTKTEQTAIANVLSDADTWIQSLDRLIDKKREIKQGAMQTLLNPYENGRLKDGWVVRRLGDVIVHCSSGATPYRGIPEYYKGDVKWITSGELNYNVIKDTIEKISKDAVIKTNLKIHSPGTFLMAITGLEAEGTRGSCGIVGSPAATNQSCMAIYPTKELETNYLYHYYVFKGDELALEYCQGTKQQSYTAKIVKILPISLPSTIEEQTRIVTILSDMDNEITALETKLAKAQQIKQGMIQNLLTGRIRLI